MNGDIIIRLSSIIGVLNNIDVKGRQNLLNLGGAIDALEKIGQEMAAILAKQEDKPAPPEKEEG